MSTALAEASPPTPPTRYNVPLPPLPPTWSYRYFGDVLDVQGGGQPPKSQFRYEPTPGYVQLLQIRDFGEKPVPTFVREETVTKRCVEEDVLIARYGASLGRIVTGKHGAYNVALAKIIFDRDQFYNRYLFYLLQTPFFQTPIHMISRSAQNGFNKGDLSDILLPVAPFDEQQHIVAEIEKQFTRLDAGVASLKRAQTALKRYRASVLKAACEGDWETASLGSLAVESSYGTSAKCNYPESGIPVLRIPNIQNGRIDLTDLKFAASPLAVGDEAALKPNDFLIVRTNGSRDLIGRGALVESDFDRPHYFASYLIRFRIRDYETAEWLSTVWNSESIRQQILRIAATSAGQYNVNQTNLSKITIPLPPAEERTRIVADVERRSSVVEDLEALVFTALQRAGRLRQAVLARAFSAGQIEE